MSDNWDSSRVEQKISINFKYDETLRLALIHPSYAKLIEEPEIDNQRLTYLGETMLNLIIVDYICDNFSHFQVGKLKALRDKLTESDRLTKLWYDLQLGESYPFLGLKEERHRLRVKQSNPFEKAFKALVGAIYIDRGFSQARNWLQKHLIVPLLKPYLKPELSRDSSVKQIELLGNSLLEGVAVDYLYRHILSASPTRLKSLAKKLTAKDSQSKYVAQIPDAAWGEIVSNENKPKSCKTLLAKVYLNLNESNSKSSFRKVSSFMKEYCFDDDEIMERAISLLLKDGKPQKWIIHNVMGYPSNKYNEGREKFHELQKLTNKLDD
ncbi:ribonuclease III [Waterburya agarophytonicola K14]|uniref:Ribonuclease III n=1 Tax=Waterburya agarophytonicola KI4 TaxID=2874699 RepID=A0A964BPT6_9CYAN|nr:ribonuclease III domain-containing protein [Waterburya agarophytonicola]MCC0177054.1 ribonuclease III [Waterburya agarophytonicola KI4]